MATNTYEIKPLRDCVGEGGLVRKYAHGPGRDQRIEGDQYLLVRLTKQCYGQTPPGGAPLTVGELPEGVLRGIVDEVETLLYGTWRLDGEDSEPLLDRLDAHFRAVGEAWLADRLERDARGERLQRELAELDVTLAAQRDAQDRQISGPAGSRPGCLGGTAG